MSVTEVVAAYCAPPFIEMAGLPGGVVSIKMPFMKVAVSFRASSRNFTYTVFRPSPGLRLQDLAGEYPSHPAPRKVDKLLIIIWLAPVEDIERTTPVFPVKAAPPLMRIELPVGAMVSTVIAAVTADGVAFPARSVNFAYTILRPSPEERENTFAVLYSSQTAPESDGLSLKIILPTPETASSEDICRVARLVRVKVEPPFIVTAEE